MLFLVLVSCAIVGTEGDSQHNHDTTRDDPPPTPEGVERPAWLVSALDAHNADLDEADRHEKYCRMAESPFVFFRGTAHLWWAEVTTLPELARFGGDAPAEVWAQGDLHIENFGTFHNDNNTVVWDLNDFDEGVVADFQLDLWRLTTSVELVTRQRNWPAEGLPKGVAEAYLDTMLSLADGDALGPSGLTASAALGPVQELLLDVAQDDREDMLDTWTVRVDDERRFDLDNPRLAAVSASDREALAAAWPAYRVSLTGGLDANTDELNILDVAARLDAGTGSLGTPRLYVLTRGGSDDPDDDLILEVKRQGEPAAWPTLSAAAQSAQATSWSSHAERVTLAQRALTDDVDDTLGWLTLPDGDYSVRQRSPWKDGLDLDRLTEPEIRALVAQQWGDVAARDHARAGGFRPLLTPHRIEATVTMRAGSERDAWLTQIQDLSVQRADAVVGDYAIFLAERAPSDCPTP